jgi:hypothetical protein
MKNILLAFIFLFATTANALAIYEYKIAPGNKYHTEPLAVPDTSTKETDLGRISSSILSPVGILVGGLIGGLASGLAQGTAEAVEKTY